MYVGASLWVNSEMGPLCSTPASTPCPVCEWSLTWIYVGASLWVNSEMGTSLLHTCQYSPGCEWSLTWMYVGASLWMNSEMGTSLFHTCQYSNLLYLPEV